VTRFASEPANYVQNGAMLSCRAAFRSVASPVRPSHWRGLWLVVALLPAAGLAQKPARAPADHATALYKWVDEQGVTHFGDAIPPQYADREKAVLNAQGVQVGTIAGKLSPEEAAREAAARAAEEGAHASQLHDRERDQHLLATYLTVEEIEGLRDRRVEILDGQARVTQQYLEHLREHEHQLLVQLQRYKPYALQPTAGPMPDRVAEDMVRTESDIINQQRNLDGKRQEALSMKEQFDSDIARFRQLKRVETEMNRGLPQ
jgi:Domain of unknown function (DUF4124)